MKWSIEATIITAVVTLAILGFAALLASKPDNEDYRVTPPVFGKAVVVCANLGGLRYFTAVKLNQETTRVRAICNIGVEVRFQIRYDGKTEGETK